MEFIKHPLIRRFFILCAEGQFPKDETTLRTIVEHLSPNVVDKEGMSGYMIAVLNLNEDAIRILQGYDDVCVHHKTSNCLHAAIMMLIGPQGCYLSASAQMKSVFDKLQKYKSRKPTCEAPGAAVRVAKLIFRRREKSMASLLNPTPNGQHPLVCMALANRPHHLWSYILRNWRITPGETYWQTVKVILTYDSVDQLNALMKGINSEDIVKAEITKGINILHLAVDHLAQNCVAYLLGWPNVRIGCTKPGFPSESCTAILTRMIDLPLPGPWGVQAYTNIFRTLLGYYKTDINHFSIGYSALHRCMMRGTQLALTILLESVEINVNNKLPSRTATPLVCACLLYTSPSPRDGLLSRMPSSA